MARREIRRELVAFFIDDTLGRSKRLRGMSRRVVQAQEKLRGLVDDAGWAAYLELEEAVNQRASKQLRLVFPL